MEGRRGGRESDLSVVVVGTAEVVVKRTGLDSVSLYVFLLCLWSAEQLGRLNEDGEKQKRSSEDEKKDDDD